MRRQFSKWLIILPLMMHSRPTSSWVSSALAVQAQPVGVLLGSRGRRIDVHTHRRRRRSVVLLEARWVWLDRLRRGFPGWVALFDPFASVWVAGKGRERYVTGATP